MSPSPLAQLLGLQSSPVAITFVDTPPAGVPRVAASEPASCGYWRRAAAGEVFFTLSDDHKRCPVGAHTHHVPLTSAEQDELMGLVTTMVELSYLKMEDVPKIPRRKTPMQAAVYSPLSRAPIPPDVGTGPRQRQAVDAARRGRRECGRRRRLACHGPSNLCGLAGIDQCWPHCGQPRMCREPRVHGSRRHRRVFCHSRLAVGRRREESGDHRTCE